MTARSGRLSLLLALLVALPAAAAVQPVVMNHNDDARSGAYLTETKLTTSNVNGSQFGKLFSRQVDDEIYVQPLYVPGLSIAGGTHDVVYVATVAGTVYAFDALDPKASTPLWKVNLLESGGRPPNAGDISSACGITYKDFSGNFSIVGTPAIDLATQTLYVVARTRRTDGSFVQALHALDITTGRDRLTRVLLNPGSFDGLRANQRPALVLANGRVYVSWASHNDCGSYHGLVAAYDAATLAQTAVFNATPGGSKAGIWMSGQGPAVDSAGNLYLTTGNGTDGNGNYGDAVVKLTPDLKVASYFIPYNYADLNAQDLDLGSGGVLLLPGTSLALAGGKTAIFYLMKQSSLGGLSSGTSDNVVQEFPVIGSGNIHGSPVYWDGPGKPLVYVWNENHRLKAFQFDPSSGLFNTNPVSKSTMTAPTGMPGAMLSVSANGATSGTGIVWASLPFSGNANHAVVPGVLRAFDAANVGVELWNSEQNSSRDTVGMFAKFVPPTVANGHVYLSTFSHELQVYGLLGASTPPPSSDAPPTVSLASPTGSSHFTAPATINLSAIASDSDGSVSKVEFLVGGTVVGTSTSSPYSFSWTNVPAGTYSIAARATDNAGLSTTSSSVSIVVDPAAGATDLVAWYKFDESSGTSAADSSGNGLTATLFSNAAFASGLFGNACSFDGTSSYVQRADASVLNPRSAMSASAWFKADAWGGNRRIVEKGRTDTQYWIRAQNGNFEFGIYGVGTAVASLPTTGVWHHVAGTYDGSSVRLYVDGQLVATKSATGSIPVTADPLFVGTKHDGGTTTDHFAGRIDDVRIYPRALSASEVSTLATKP